MLKQGEIMNDNIPQQSGNGEYSYNLPFVIESKKGELTAIDAQEFGDIMRHQTEVVKQVVEHSTKMSDRKDIRTIITEKFIVSEET